MILSLFLFFWVLYVEAHCSELIVLFICNILRSSANSSQVGSRTVGLVFSVSICICLLYRGEHLAYSTVQIKKKIPFWLSILCSCVCLTLHTHLWRSDRIGSICCAVTFRCPCMILEATRGRCGSGLICCLMQRSYVNTYMLSFGKEIIRGKLYFCKK